MGTGKTEGGIAIAWNRKPERRDPVLPAEPRCADTGVAVSNPVPAFVPGDSDVSDIPKDRMDRVLQAWGAAAAVVSTPPAGDAGGGTAGTLVTLRDVAWNRARRQAAERTPVGRCRTCWTRWARDLLEGQCICTGTVSQAFVPPGELTLRWSYDASLYPATPAKSDRRKHKGVLARSGGG